MYFLFVKTHFGLKQMQRYTFFLKVCRNIQKKYRIGKLFSAFMPAKQPFWSL